MNHNIFSVMVAPGPDGDLTVNVVTDDGNVTGVLITGGALTVLPVATALINAIATGAYIDAQDVVKGMMQ
jgi:hypothetical protein